MNNHMSLLVKHIMLFNIITFLSLISSNKKNDKHPIRNASTILFMDELITENDYHLIEECLNNNNINIVNGTIYIHHSEKPQPINNLKNILKKVFSKINEKNIEPYLKGFEKRQAEDREEYMKNLMKLSDFLKNILESNNISSEIW